jgi:hypothetical protein
MDHHREHKLQQLKAQVRSGEYRVDPVAVADAVVHRVWGFDVDPALSPVPLAAAPSRIRRRTVTGGPRRPAGALAGAR